MFNEGIPGDMLSFSAQNTHNATDLERVLEGFRKEAIEKELEIVDISGLARYGSGDAHMFCLFKSK